MTVETVRLDLVGAAGAGDRSDERRTATVPVSVAAPGPAEDPPRGAVVVIADARGITEYVLSVCEQLRGAGWLAITPHLYHRDGITEVALADCATTMLTLTGEGIDADVDACLDYLRTAGLPPRRTAIIGFCMGGTVAFRAATRHQLAAAVSFYGGAVSTPYWSGVPPLLEIAGDLRAPWLGLYGENDTWVSTDEITRLRAAAAHSPVPTELISYPGAAHAFHTPERPETYHPEAARDAWGRMLAWLDAHAGTS
jgi:carboxymethylenebutenolidase